MTKAIAGLSILGMLLFLVPERSNAQSSGFTIYGGISLPMGDFGSNSGTEAGYAELGYLGGLEYASLFNEESGLGWMVSATYITNPVDEQEFVGTGVDVGNWINVPVMGGIQIQSELSEGLQIYGQGQAGVNFAQAPSIEGGGIEATTDWETTFGFAVGAGVLISDLIDIGARYLILGEPEFEYSTSEGSTGAAGSQKISMLEIGIGIRIGSR